jgi:PTS system fructose-specific IIA component
MKNVVAEEMIFVNTSFNSQKDLFEFIADTAFGLGRTSDVKSVVDGFYHREGEYSTAMNDGIAIPHCRTESILDASVIIIRNSEKVIWTEDEECDLFFALLVPESNVNQMHIRILAQVAQLLLEDEFVAQVRQANDPSYIFDLVKELNTVL